MRDPHSNPPGWDEALEDTWKEGACALTWRRFINGSEISPTDESRSRNESLYRVLQRFQNTEFVTSTAKAGVSDPDLKVYQLNPVGDRVLYVLIKRDVMLFLKADVVRLLDLPACLAS